VSAVAAPIDASPTGGPDPAHPATPPGAPLPSTATREERSTWTPVRGWQLHCRSWGAARGRPVVVAVHGLGVASRMCRPLAEHLADRWPVLAPDLPGFGLSEGPGWALDVRALGASLADLLTQQDLTDVVLVGTSLGASVAAETAALAPERVRAAVLASPIVDAGRRSWPQQLVRWQLEQRTQSTRARVLMLSDYRRCGMRRVLRTFSAAMAHPVEDTVARLRCPVTVCWGTRDPLVSRSFAAELARRAPEGELRVMPGVVHNMAHERPLELSRVVAHVIGSTHGG
jgi:2-hydroxy-6-oxonona-2,4-dienedioate hydrolase